MIDVNFPHLIEDCRKNLESSETFQYTRGRKT
ncbi:MAG: hypothetical protein XD91_0502 [Clostridiales bacterium 38_11]|nr:MAG: hypothetical protein XD91_0502 [Clostridiales bacterium 38_11]